MKSIIAAAAIAAASCAAAPAVAQPLNLDGAYGDLGWSQTEAQGAGPGSITARAGARWGRYFGLEGELGYGVTTGSRTYGEAGPNPVNVDVKSKLGAAAYAVGYAPIGPNLDLLARVGYGVTNYRISPDGGPDYNIHDHGIRYGVGGQYFLDGRNGIRIDYTRERLGGDDSGGFFSADNNASVWSVAYAHKF